MKGKGKVLSALLAAALFVGAAIPALAAGENGKAGTAPKATAAVEITPKDSGTVTGDKTYYVGGSVSLAAGEHVELTANANTGYKFSGWTYGSKTSSSTSLDVTYEIANSTEVITAAFDKIAEGSKVLKVAITPKDSGTVRQGTAPVTGDIEVKEGATVSLTAEAAKGYEFVSWSLNGTVTKETALTVKYADLKDDTNTLTVTFKETAEEPAPAGRKVFITVNPEGSGTVQGPDGKEVTAYWFEGPGNDLVLKAVPGAGYEFAEWTFGSKKSTDATYIVKYADLSANEADNQLIATFKEKTIEIPDKPADTGNAATDKALDEMNDALEAHKDVINAALESGSTIEDEKAIKALTDTATGVVDTIRDDKQLDALDQASKDNLEKLVEVLPNVDASAETSVAEDVTAEEEVAAPESDTFALAVNALKYLSRNNGADKVTLSLNVEQVAKTNFGKDAKAAFDMTLNLIVEKDSKETSSTISTPAHGIAHTVVIPGLDPKVISVDVYKTNAKTPDRNVKPTHKDGKFTFTMPHYSSAVFTTKSAVPTTRPTYSGGGGGGMAGFTSYVITATAGPGGSISNPGESRYDAGTYVTYRITPDAGYVIDKVIVDGTKEVALTNGTYTFPLLDQPYTINATFRPVSGSAGEPSAPATAAPNPSTGDSWFAHLFF